MTIKGMVIIAMFFGCRMSGGKNGILGGRLKQISAFPLLSEYHFKRLEFPLRERVKAVAADGQSVAAPHTLTGVNILCAQRAIRKRRRSLYARFLYCFKVQKFFLPFFENMA